MAYFRVIFKIKELEFWVEPFDMTDRLTRADYAYETKILEKDARKFGFVKVGENKDGVLYASDQVNTIDEFGEKLRQMALYEEENGKHGCHRVLSNSAISGETQLQNDWLWHLVKNPDEGFISCENYKKVLKQKEKIKMKMAIEKRNTLSNSLLAAGILYRQTGAKKWKDLEEKLTEILNAENNSSI